MIKDIHTPEVTDIAIAVVREAGEEGDVWNVYLVNLKDVAIESVLVSSTGYGTVNDEPVKTSVLRHFLDRVGPMSFVKIEPIIEDVFVLNNEYWVSFYIDKVIHDKKFIFLPGTINEAFFTSVPIVFKKGVMIK
ncbi:MAG TPA: hypothetical protein PK281_11000 [Flavobacteriales bacterium]|nr:hypothetical protein [Flavobacteriales bacterium]